MSSIDSFLRRYNFEACLAPKKIWSLSEAADYLSAHLAMKENWSTRGDALNGLMSIRSNILESIEKSVVEGKLVVNEVHHESDDATESAKPALDPEKSLVRPFVMINWALAQKIEVPREFSLYVDNKKSNKTAAFEYMGVKVSTIHHERCRAIAELLWEIEPHIPIAQMARRREIIEIGCQGHQYDMRTVSRWLATLKADRHPGRVSQKKKIPQGPVKTKLENVG